MKKKHYEVVWTEIHSAFVEVDEDNDHPEQEAVSLARSLDQRETWDAFYEDDTSVREVDEEGNYLEDDLNPPQEFVVDFPERPLF